MPKPLLIVLIIIAAVAIAVLIYFAVMAKKIKSAKYVLPEGFTVTAHTGSMGTKDNSMESIEVGAANAPVIEFDVRFLKDGTPIVSHNEPKDNDFITVSQAFEALSKLEGTKANVDIKTTDNLPEVQALAEKWGVLDRIFFTGINGNFVEAVKRDCPKISYYLNFNVDPSKNKDAEYLKSVAELVKNSGAVGLNTNFRFANKEVVEAMHKENILVSLWTAKSKGQAYKILSLSPDNITTRKPDLVRQMIEK